MIPILLYTLLREICASLIYYDTYFVRTKFVRFSYGKMCDFVLFFHTKTE